MANVPAPVKTDTGTVLTRTDMQVVVANMEELAQRRATSDTCNRANGMLRSQNATLTTDNARLSSQNVLLNQDNTAKRMEQRIALYRTIGNTIIKIGVTIATLVLLSKF